jgi:cystathionine beta-synthase
VIQIPDKEAYAVTMRLAKEEAIFVGSSGGASVAGAMKVAERMKPEQLVVVILPDTGTRYLSKLNEEWLRSKGLLD